MYSDLRDIPQNLVFTYNGLSQRNSLEKSQDIEQTEAYVYVLTSSLVYVRPLIVRRTTANSIQK